MKSGGAISLPQLVQQFQESKGTTIALYLSTWITSSPASAYLRWIENQQEAFFWSISLSLPALNSDNGTRMPFMLEVKRPAENREKET
jgi:hypothetical protein